MTSPIIPEQCELCKNNLWFAKGEKVIHCKAFPKGVPIDILMDRHDHRKPYSGDNGIRFKSI
jgi:hypothetical protein